MTLKSLLLCSDEKTVRVLRRVLSDLEIAVEHCTNSEAGLRRITRQRFEAIILDCCDLKDSAHILRAIKTAPVNKRALSIALVESPVGLKGGFDMGAQFVLHKPLTVERAKSSFRAVRALMKRERRLQLRVPVQIPLECIGTSRYQAKTLDLCEGGMAIEFKGRRSKETVLRFCFQLPGTADKLELWGEMAWEGSADRAGVRFKELTPDQHRSLRNWLSSQVPDQEPDDPPVACRLNNLSMAGCYLNTASPFPKSTRVILSVRPTGAEIRTAGIVRIAHPEFGMGVEFLQSSPAQKDQVRQMILALRSSGPLEICVEPDGLDTAALDSPSAFVPATNDVLVNLFHQKADLPTDAFLQQMQLCQHQESR